MGLTNQEIDEAVARKLHGDDWRMWIAERYSTDIKAAWEILDYVASRGETWDLEKDSSGTFYCTLKPSYTKRQADTAPLAICKAFLSMEGV